MCRFKKAQERQIYVEAMKTLLPILYERMMAILSDHSVVSVTLQHHILKIFYSTMQVRDKTFFRNVSPDFSRTNYYGEKFFFNLREIFF